LALPPYFRSTLGLGFEYGIKIVENHFVSDRAGS
jgi:hypothetical protein